MSRSCRPVRSTRCLTNRLTSGSRSRRSRRAGRSSAVSARTFVVPSTVTSRGWMGNRVNLSGHADFRIRTLDRLHALGDPHGLFDEGLDDLALGDGLDDFALDEDLALAV